MKHFNWTYLLGIAACSFLMSFIFLIGHEHSPEAVPASLAFSFLGLLSGATAVAVRDIGKRLDVLEEASAKQTLPPMPAESGEAGKPPGSSPPGDESP